MLSQKALAVISALAVSGVLIGNVTWDGGESLTDAKSVMNEMYQKITRQEKSIGNLMKGIEDIKDVANMEIDKIEVALSTEKEMTASLTQENKTLSKANNELNKANNQLTNENDKLKEKNQELESSQGELQEEYNGVLEYAKDLEKSLTKANNQAQNLGDFSEAMREKVEGVGDEVIKPDISLGR